MLIRFVKSERPFGRGREIGENSFLCKVIFNNFLPFFSPDTTNNHNTLIKKHLQIRKILRD